MKRKPFATMTSQKNGGAEMTYFLSVLICIYVIAVTGIFAVTLMDVDGEFRRPETPDKLKQPEI